MKLYANEFIPPKLSPFPIVSFLSSNTIRTHFQFKNQPPQPLSTSILTKKKPSIPFQNFGGDGEILHFAHANGFHPLTYQQMLNPLTEHFQVIAIQHRPFWQKEPTAADDWKQIADDLIRFLEEQEIKNIVGVGHSLGAVATMFAAIKRPDLFRKIVLIEPVFLPEILINIFYLVPVSWRKYLNPLIRKTLKRRAVWENKEAVFSSYRSKKLFANLSDEVLWDYLHSGLSKQANGKVTLTYSKEWEAHFFGLAPKIWQPLKTLKTPTLGIRGEYSDTLRTKPWKKWQRLQPNHAFLEIENTGHLLPLEQPKLVAKNILAFLQN